LINNNIELKTSIHYIVYEHKQNDLTSINLVGFAR
jgi:hypothetical protein